MIKRTKIKMILSALLLCVTENKSKVDRGSPRDRVEVNFSSSTIERLRKRERDLEIERNPKRDTSRESRERKTPERERNSGGRREKKGRKGRERERERA